jgi:TolB-like protein
MGLINNKFQMLIWNSLIITILAFSSITLAQTPNEKINLAVLNLDAIGVTVNTSQVLTNVIRKQLKETQVYRLVDRNRMTEILEEQGFQQSGCISSECAVEVGKLLGVQKMITGTISKLGELYVIDLQLIDVATGEIEYIDSEQYVGNIEGLLDPVRDLANRITTGIKDAIRETTIYVTSVPIGAKVYINSDFVGNTPYKSPFEARNIQVRVTQDGYSDWSQMVEVIVGQNNIISANLSSLRSADTVSNAGNLFVKCDVDGRDIFIDGGWAGKTPLKMPIKLSQGKHTVSFFSSKVVNKANNDLEQTNKTIDAITATQGGWAALGYTIGSKDMFFKAKVINTGTKEVFIQRGMDTTVYLKWSQIVALEKNKQQQDKKTKKRAITCLFIVLVLALFSS